MKEHVEFDEVLTISDDIVSPSLRLGVFNEKAESKGRIEYRLFSVVEHIGNRSSQGHYISYTMDSEDQWMKFDDTRIRAVNLN